METVFLILFHVLPCPIQLNPAKVSVERGDRQYFKLNCTTLTDEIIISARDLQGASSIYVSSSDENPAPFDYGWKDDSGRGEKVLRLNRSGSAAQGPIYIGIQGTSNATSKISLRVYNSLFLRGAGYGQAEVAEGTKPGEAVFSPPAPSVNGVIVRGKIRYRLVDDAGAGAGSGALPFSVDPDTGVLRTTRTPLVRAKQDVWSLHIIAEAVDEACLRGAFMVRVNVAASTSTTTTTTTSVTTTTTTTTTTSTTTTTTPTTPREPSAGALALARTSLANPVFFLLFHKDRSE